MPLLKVNQRMAKFYKIVSWLIGVIVIGQIFRYGRPGMDFIAVISGVPLLIFLAAGHFSGRIKNKFAHALIALVCFIVFLGWGALSLGSEFIKRAVTPVTKPSAYAKTLGRAAGFAPQLVSHFPKEIPGTAKKVKFYYMPGFLQSATVMQLRYQTSAEDIARLYEHYQKAARKRYIGGNTNIHMNTEEGMPTTFFFTSDSGDRTFSDDYEIMTLDPVIRSADRPEGFYFNHGQSHGVAISRERNEVIFWAESW